MAQLDLFNDQKNSKEPVAIQNGEYIHIPDFFGLEDCRHFTKYLTEKITWKQEEMSLYGRQIKFPRLTAWYGDQDKQYSFSGITLSPEAWTEELTSIRRKAEQASNSLFNSVLLNLYRDGNDSISWHTDAEKELSENPIIASVSFGASRNFQLRHIQTKQKISIELTNGSLLIMKGSLQHFWQHQIPKSRKVISQRINLTFRKIL